MNYLFRRAVSFLTAFFIIIPVFAESSPTSLKHSNLKWVDFDIPAEFMRRAMDIDIASHENEEEAPVNWIELLAYVAAKNGGKFSKAKKSEIDKTANEIKNGKSIAEMTDGMKHYSYYLEAYTAVLGGLVGEYEEKSGDGYALKYGLRAFLPIAKGYGYNHYDDFGVGRNYGYNRKHLGHDMMALVGTPVIAVESGVVEEAGWNQYGGWRLGIRSFDGMRYYYYAHLRQNRPFAEGIERGKTVMAGEVIGYVGRTGYSRKENVNGITESHLHWGLQLVFDEAEKEGVNQVWIDLYEITRFLASKRSETVRNAETKEHSAVKPLRVTVPEEHFVPPDNT